MRHVFTLSAARATNVKQLVKEWRHSAYSGPILFVLERQETLVASRPEHAGQPWPIGLLFASTPVSNARLEMYICRVGQTQSHLSIPIFREIAGINVDPGERRIGGLDNVHGSFSSCRETSVIFNSEKNAFAPRVF